MPSFLSRLNTSGHQKMEAGEVFGRIVLLPPECRS
jgi:hypothetical protein